MVVETRIEHPSIGIVPYGVSQLDGALALGGVTLTLDDASVFEDSGFIKIESDTSTMQANQQILLVD